MKFTVCRFEKGDRGGMVCYRPGDCLGFVVLVRSNGDVLPGEDYLCEVVKSLPTGTRFVRTVEAAKDVLKDVSSALCAAQWKCGEHVTSDTTAQIVTEAYGAIRASWYESTGRYRHKFLTLEFKMGGDRIRLSFDHTSEDMDAIGAQVRRCVGPTINLSAAIARQRDARCGVRR